jgi:hypothetical protein
MSIPGCVFCEPTAATLPIRLAVQKLHTDLAPNKFVWKLIGDWMGLSGVRSMNSDEFDGILPLRSGEGTIEGMGNMLVGLCCTVLLTAAENGAPTTLTAAEHPWGSFLPNSWCIVQTVTVSNFEGRIVRSVQTVRTTLRAVDENSVTLEELETQEFGGKIVEKKPQIIKYDFFQEPIQENVQITQGTPVKLMFDKKVVPCAVRMYNQQTSSGPLTTTIWYTPQVYPYVLRVEKILRSAPDGDNPDGQIIRQSVTLVQETSALKSLRIRRNQTYSFQTRETSGNITKITDARCSWDKPGGLLESTTREFDAQNREIRRSVSQMTNYFSHELIPGPTQRYRTLLPVEVLD